MRKDGYYGKYVKIVSCSATYALLWDLFRENKMSSRIFFISNAIASIGCFHMYGIDFIY